MKNLRKFENFDGFDSGEEHMDNDHIFGGEAQGEEGAQAFGGQESEEEENLELDEFVDRVLAAIEECGEDCDEEEKREKVRAVLADFHAAQESQEEEEHEHHEDDEELGYEEHDGAFGEESRIEDEEQYERKSLKRFGDFK